MNKRDEEGRLLDCHFLKMTGRKPSCAALVDFYNAENPKDKCGLCPFFKTDAEFDEGWKRRRTDAVNAKFREAV